MNRCCKIPCNMNSSNSKTLQVARKTDRQSTKSQKQTQNGRKHPQTNPDPWTIALRIIKLCYIIFAHMVGLRFLFLLRPVLYCDRRARTRTSWSVRNIPQDNNIAFNLGSELVPWLQAETGSTQVGHGGTCFESRRQNTFSSFKSPSMKKIERIQFHIFS